MRLRRHLHTIVLAIALTGCTPPPPNLTPQATVAFQNTQIIKALDLVRDIAIDANAQTPPLVSTELTRKIVTYHQSALRTIDARAAGWQTTVQTGLTEVLTDLPANQQALLAPYVALVTTVLKEVR